MCAAGILNTYTGLWQAESERATPVDYSPKTLNEKIFTIYLFIYLFICLSFSGTKMSLLRLSIVRNIVLHQLVTVFFCYVFYLGSCRGETPSPIEVMSDHDYCVIGAGPAGLQLGFFFEKAGRDYIIFERSNNTGKFIAYHHHQ